MYLFIFVDGTFKQVNENLSVTDLVAVKSGLLKILRSHLNSFQALTFKQEKLVWSPVPEAKVLTLRESRIHQ